MAEQKIRKNLVSVGQVQAETKASIKSCRNLSSSLWHHPFGVGLGLRFQAELWCKFRTVTFMRKPKEQFMSSMVGDFKWWQSTVCHMLLSVPQDFMHSRANCHLRLTGKSNNLLNPDLTKIREEKYKYRTLYTNPRQSSLPTWTHKVDNEGHLIKNLHFLSLCSTWIVVETKNNSVRREGERDQNFGPLLEDAFWHARWPGSKLCRLHGVAEDTWSRTGKYFSNPISAWTDGNST